MSSRKDDFRLVRVGDRIINWDRVDYVQYKAEEKHATGGRPASLAVFFSSSSEPLLLSDSEASGLFSFLANRAAKKEIE